MKNIIYYIKKILPSKQESDFDLKESGYKILEKIEKNKFIHGFFYYIYKMLSTVFEKIESLVGYEKRKINYGILIGIFIVFISMLLLNLYTPYISSDFTNMFILGTSRVDSIDSFIESQKYLYENKNANLVVNLVNQFLLFIDKDLSGFINTMAFTLFIYYIYCFYSRNITDELIVTENGLELIEAEDSKAFYQAFTLLMILTIYFLLWSFVPYYGNVFLWISGSSSYLWMILITVVYLLHIRSMASDFSKKIGLVRRFIFVILAFFIAMVNNYLTPIILFLSLYYLLKMLMEKKNEIIYILFMFINMAIGYLVMITSPANVKTANKSSFSFIELIQLQFMDINSNIYYYMKILVVIALLMLIVARLMNSKKNMEAELYFIASILCVYILGSKKSIDIRSMIFPITIMLISIVISMYDIASKRKWLAYIFVILIFMPSMFYHLTSYPSALSDSKEYFQKYNAREITIIDSKSSGVREKIGVSPLYGTNKYIGAYEMDDCTANPKYYLNIALSKYYEVDSIVLR